MLVTFCFISLSFTQPILKYKVKQRNIVLLKNKRRPRQQGPTFSFLTGLDRQHSPIFLFAFNLNSFHQGAPFVFMCFNNSLSSNAFCLLLQSCFNLCASQYQYEFPLHMQTWALGHNEMSFCGPFALYPFTLHAHIQYWAFQMAIQNVEYD